MVPCKSTAEEVSFKWSHHRILSTDSKVRTTLHVSISDSGREKGEHAEGLPRCSGTGSRSRRSESLNWAWLSVSTQFSSVPRASICFCACFG